MKQLPVAVVQLSLGAADNGPGAALLMSGGIFRRDPQLHMLILLRRQPGAPAGAPARPGSLARLRSLGAAERRRWA
jgi:hypothetical protein